MAGGQGEGLAGRSGARGRLVQIALRRRIADCAITRVCTGKFSECLHPRICGMERENCTYLHVYVFV